MPASRMRHFNKSTVKEQLVGLRDYLNRLTSMSIQELDEEFKKMRPGDLEEIPSREYMILGLILNRTYYIEAILNIG